MEAYLSFPLLGVFLLSVEVFVVATNYNPDHNILKLYDILLQVQLAASKPELDSSILSVSCSLSHRFSSNFKVKILGN